MKKKKARSATAGKPAARAVGSVRSKRKAARSKARSSKPPSSKAKRPAKSATAVRRRVAKPKTVRKRASRKASTRRSSIRIRRKPASRRADLDLELESKPSSSAPAEAVTPPEEVQPQPLAGLRIPQILLEGDEPASPPSTGPGQKYSLGPSALAAGSVPAEAALPEAYGTGRLLLAARDPHWLYAQWDLTPQQQRRYNALSADRHLVIRVHSAAGGTAQRREIHVHPESRHWFIHVAQARTQYTAELGYYGPRREWARIALSPPAETPPDSASADQTVRFATVPVPLPPAAAVQSAQPTPPPAPPPFEPAHQRILAELAGLPQPDLPGVSSADVASLGGGWAEQESSALMELPTSPMDVAGQPAGGFWLSVNAEIVVYGATEPGACVTIGGRAVEVRADGTFSCRMSLPDGHHGATVSALSPAGEVREATLQFSRRTHYRGEVSEAPPDPSLQPPAADPGL